MWMAFLAAPLERRIVLPSMATTPSGTPIRAATQATKQRWNASASRVARMSPRWSWAGVPAAKGRRRRGKSSFFSPKRAMSVTVSAPASTAKRHRSSTSASGYITFPRCLTSGRSLKQLRKTIVSANAPPSTANSPIDTALSQIRGHRQIQHFNPLSRNPFTRLPWVNVEHVFTNVDADVDSGFSASFGRFLTLHAGLAPNHLFRTSARDGRTKLPHGSALRDTRSRPPDAEGVATPSASAQSLRRFGPTGTCKGTARRRSRGLARPTTAPTPATASVPPRRRRPLPRSTRA